jgi:hypothetical protein
MCPYFNVLFRKYPEPVTLLKEGVYSKALPLTFIFICNTLNSKKNQFGRDSMMKATIFLIFLTIPILFDNSVFAVTCKCEFDTTRYSAVAEGDGYCGSITRDGKHCNVTFNGNIKSAKNIEPSSIYGPIERYLIQIKEINSELLRTHYLVSAQNPDWLIRNLPLLVRSAYATVPFLNYGEREKLDEMLNIFFRNYGKEIYKALTGKQQPPFIRENFEISRGRILFKKEDISIIFEISIPERF